MNNPPMQIVQNVRDGWYLHDIRGANTAIWVKEKARALYFPIIMPNDLMRLLLSYEDGAFGFRTCKLKFILPNL